MNQSKADNAATLLRISGRAWRQAMMGLLAGGVLLAVAGSAVAAPFVDPGPVHPIGRWINLTMNQSANSAHVRALIMDGYEISPPITIDLDAG